MHLAYQWVMVALMLTASNRALEQLHLAKSGTLPITRTQLSEIFVMKPEIEVGGGRIDIGDISFCFGQQHLQYIHRLKPYGELGELEAIEPMLKERAKSVITTNDAYRMAVNWLDQLSVDTRCLEDMAPMRSEQAGVYWETPGKKRLYPIFEVRWGQWDDPHAKICIDGRTKDLIYLRLETKSLGCYPPICSLKNVKGLLAISDKEFLAYSSAEKRRALSKTLAC